MEKGLYLKPFLDQFKDHFFLFLNFCEMFADLWLVNEQLSNQDCSCNLTSDKRIGKWKIH